MRWYVDGAGWNEKISRYCVVRENQITELKTFSTEYTNNEMEYMALISALKQAQPGDEICTDAQLLVSQVKGEYKVRKPHLAPYVQEARNLVSEKQIKLTKIPRYQNRAGKPLEWKD